MSPYIVLVDDDADGRDALARMFEHVGYEVALHSDGKAALARIMARIPDVIVLDLFMPTMDGVKLLEVLRSYLRLRPLRVVILTASPDSPLTKEAHALGATRVLAKSKATFAQIEAAVREELANLPPGDLSAMDFRGW